MQYKFTFMKKKIEIHIQMHYYIYILFLFSPLCTFLQVSVSSRANLLKKIKEGNFKYSIH